MKLYTMKCVKDPEVLPEEGGGMLGQKEYFVKLEDRYEQDIYDDAINSGDDNDYADFNRWLKDNIRLTDYDIYFYFLANAPELPIGSTYEDANGLIWKRVE